MKLNQDWIKAESDWIKVRQIESRLNQRRLYKAEPSMFCTQSLEHALRALNL